MAASGFGLVMPAAAAPASTAPAPPPPPVVVTSAQWEPAPLGKWSAAVVTVKNESSSPFSGVVVLVPVPVERFEHTEDGQQVPVAVPVPTSQYRRAVTLEPRTEHSVVIPLVVSDTRFEVEVRDASHRVVVEATQQVAAQPSANPVAGVLTGTPAGRATVLGGKAMLSGRWVSALGFPDDVGLLAGLRAVVIADFDSATLNPAQIQALRDFVGLGGSLVLGGGDAAARTVGGLPDDLVPLRPTGVVAASLAPVAATTGGASSGAPAGDGTGAVATGSLSFGRPVLQNAGGMPLLVEADYGGGVIVQMTFDPIAEASKPARALALAARETAYDRAGLRVEPSAPSQITPARAAAAVLDVTKESDPAPASPPLALAAVGLVVLALVWPAGSLALRSRGELGRTWALAPAAALGLAVVVFAAASIPLRRQVVDQQVQVQRVGAGGVVRVDGWHRLSGGAGDAELGLPAGASAWVDVPEERSEHLPNVMSSIVGPEPARQSRPGGEMVEVGSGDTRVMIDAWPVGTTRRLETSSVQRFGGIEADLRLVGERLVGEVTNTGKVALGHVVARTPDGSRARLVDEVPSGATVYVDAPLLAAAAVADEDPGDDAAEDRVDLYAFALGTRRAGAGEVDLVAQVRGERTLRVDGRRPKGTVLAAMVATVSLAGARP